MVTAEEMCMGNDARQSPSSTKSTTTCVRVHAEFEQLAMLRAITETIAMMADFGLDEVTDIRLALDEVASVLIAAAVPDSDLDCAFVYSDGVMNVRVGANVTTDTVPEDGSFGWHIVATLTASVAVNQEPFDATVEGYPTVIDFSWERPRDEQ
ncbi:anti-sigma factor [Nocardia sp. NPDC058519]|uniref:anti-sigma factor n=1 Tax=Nocardia sp. NPDC058519 TaxID=3346535 RepID=UPI0036513FB3